MKPDCYHCISRFYSMRLEQIENKNDDPTILEMNEVIEKINLAKFYETPELRCRLIELCNQYFVEHAMVPRIPPGETADAIFNLQRRMVAIHYFLPEAATLGQARWKMLKNILIGKKALNESSELNRDTGVKTNSDHTGRQIFRTLRSEYWKEVRFEGAISSVAKWVSSGVPRVSYQQLSTVKHYADDIHYFDDPEKFKLTYDDQTKLFYQDGVVADITGESELRKTKGSELVVDLNEDIYIIPSGKSGLGTRHTSILKGGAVLFAGMCEIEDGKIKWISNESGHYQGDTKYFLRFLGMLKKKYEIDLKEVFVRVRTSSSNFYGCNADELFSAGRVPFSVAIEKEIQDLLLKTLGVDEKKSKRSLR